MRTPVETRGFELRDWQLAALTAWEIGDAVAPHRGTLEIVTGGGKTLIALEAFARATHDDPDYRLAVVVPTRALADQWQVAVAELTTVDPNNIRVLDGGGLNQLNDAVVLISVLNSAAKYLPEIAAHTPHPLMLVIDECHRAGAPVFSTVLKTQAARRLGLSATPDRDEVDDDGLPIDYDDQLLGKELGGVVSRFGLREAREAGWLPDFTIHHHAVDLLPAERTKYEELSRRIDNLADALRSQGVEPWRARFVARGHGPAAQDAVAYVGGVAQRKDLLYRSTERGRVARRIVADAMRTKVSRVLIFHERVDEAADLAAGLSADLGDGVAGLEHSQLPMRQRRAVIDAFRTGQTPVLVSVRSLIEGINVPEADVGIAVASTSSVRQRIQSLGRVLRRGSAAKRAEMHVLFVDSTTDEALYRKEDWADLTGPDSNIYLHWPIGEDAPELRAGPPCVPLALEEDEWTRHGQRVVSPPAPWLGVLPDAEYSVDTRGNVTSPTGSAIANPQGVGEMLVGAGRSGGRFRVTPQYRLVLVSLRLAEGMAFSVVGKLAEPFRSRASEDAADCADAGTLEPGDIYMGPADKAGGTYQLAARAGGCIMRKTPSGVDLAITRSESHSGLAENAATVLTVWRQLGGPGGRFFVNSCDVAWSERDGKVTFLASVPGGFLFPSTSTGAQ